MPRLSMPNRRIRGRMYGGVGGEVSNGLPYPMPDRLVFVVIIISRTLWTTLVSTWVITADGWL